jgi:major type 1 subunit fimbrin (pilin)
MNTRLLAALAFCGFALASQAAFAADGTITFNGEIVANTCTINGGAGQSFTVTLPKVMASALASSGQTAGTTPFQIALTNCTPDGGNVHAYFEAGATTDAATGRLLTSAGGAANVQIQLLNSDLTEIKAGFADALQNSKSAAVNAGSATLSYFARYYATAAATAGLVTSSVLYTIVYN